MGSGFGFVLRRCGSGMNGFADVSTRSHSSSSKLGCRITNLLLVWIYTAFLVIGLVTCNEVLFWYLYKSRLFVFTSFLMSCGHTVSLSPSCCFDGPFLDFKAEGWISKSQGIIGFVYVFFNLQFSVFSLVILAVSLFWSYHSRIVKIHIVASLLGTLPFKLRCFIPCEQHFCVLLSALLFHDWFVV